MKNKSIKVILMLLIITSFQCSKKETEKEEIVRPVNFIIVGTDTGAQTRTFTGIAKAGNEIELSFRESGVIQQIKVKKGQRVKKGDLIASLDNLEANLNYERAVTEVSSAESSMHTSKAELDRIKLLYEKGSTPLKDYQSSKNNYQRTLSQYEAAFRNQEIQRSRLNYGVIYAPSDGIIANTFGKENERVQTGHVFAILNAGDKKKVELELPEKVINRVSVGLKAQIQFSTIDDAMFNGEVIEVSPITSDNATTYPVELEIENPVDQIRPGMAARVTFDFSPQKEEGANKIVVPIKAVGEDGNGNFVFLIETEDNQTGIVRKQTIKIGEITSKGFEVESGLETGQLIATAGLQSLLDGQKVKLN
jgi:RND family efflux transporter MFP subunit